VKAIILYSTVLAFFCCGCHSPAKQEDKKTTGLSYTVPPTGKLSPSEFNYYHNALEKHFDSLLIKRGFNGGILVAKNGQVVFEGYYGFRDLRTKDSMTAETPMHIASTSKTFTGMAILQLVQEKRLSLTDTLGKFFPGFPYPGITIKMLLSHRSGLPNYLYFLSDNEKHKKNIATNDTVLNVLYTEQPHPDFKPGTRFKYCNTNFVLLAMIIEKITGTPYPVYMKQNLFDPLHLDHTFVYTLADTGKVTRSFEWNGRVWQNDNLEGTYGDKNIYSTPRDLLKWDIALSSGQVIDTTLLDSAYTGYSNERPSIHNYGLAWRLLKLPNGKKVIYHNGRWHGFNAAFARLPDEKATIIVLGNKFNRNIYSAARTAYDIFGPYLQEKNKGVEDENDSLINASIEPAAQPVKKTKTTVGKKRKHKK
jgi:CubicO group peptidase (beta-lactamase class C family)